jgi:hypothetical protein
MRARFLSAFVIVCVVASVFGAAEVGAAPGIGVQAVEVINTLPRAVPVRVTGNTRTTPFYTEVSKVVTITADVDRPVPVVPVGTLQVASASPLEVEPVGPLELQTSPEAPLYVRVIRDPEPVPHQLSGFGELNGTQVLVKSLGALPEPESEPDVYYVHVTDFQYSRSGTATVNFCTLSAAGWTYLLPVGETQWHAAHGDWVFPVSSVDFPDGADFWLNTIYASPVDEYVQCVVTAYVSLQP